PLIALLHLMRDGTWQGAGAGEPGFRALFTRENLFASDWYKARLKAQQRRDVRQAETQAAYLEKLIARPNYHDVAETLHVSNRLAAMQVAATAARSPNYVEGLVGTLGVDPALVD